MLWTHDALTTGGRRSVPAATVGDRRTGASNPPGLSRGPPRGRPGGLLTHLSVSNFPSGRLCLPESQSADRQASSSPQSERRARRRIDCAGWPILMSRVTTSLIVVNAAADVRGRHGRDVHRRPDGWRDVAVAGPGSGGQSVWLGRVEPARGAFRPLGVRIDGGGRRLQRSPRCRRHRAA